MIKRILIPTDGYGLEDHVVRYVARAFSFADFHVISVVNTYERGVQLTGVLREEMKKSALAAIDRAEKILEEEGIHLIHTKILEGLPSREILRYAKTHEIDLLAMRVYCRKSTASAHRLGSTLKEVMKKSNVPILTLAEEMQRYEIRRVLLLSDGTLKSKMAENYSILLASSYSASLEAVYLYSEKENFSQKLDNVVWKASHWNVKVKKRAVAIKDMGKLMSVMGNNDIAVMGIGKRTLLGRKIGHITQFVVTHSPIPVILVGSLGKRWYKRMQLR